MHRNRTVHRIRSPRIREKLRLAVASDLHSAPFEEPRIMSYDTISTGRLSPVY